MARSLFINGSDIFRNTLIQADTDPDKLIPFIEGYQDKDLQDWLGSNLYETIDLLIANAGASPVVMPNINEDMFSAYKDLVTNHLQRIVEQGSARLYIEFAPFTVSNKGVFKYSATDATPASEKEIRKIINKIKEREEFYKERTQDFLCNSSGLFPEFIQTNANDLPPSYETYDYGFITV